MLSSALVLVGAVNLAHASEPLFEELVVEMAPTGEVLGSGLDRYDLTVIILALDGTPITGIEGKFKAASGETGEVVEVGPGLYRMPWTPERVEAPTVVDLRLKGKTLDKQKIDRTWSMPVKPPYGHQVSISVDPSQLVLGRDSQASLSIDLAGGAEGVRTGADLMFTVNSGEIGTPAPLGGGKYAALYTPPEGGAPHLALLGVADRREPSRTYGHLAIPLAVKSDIVVEAARDCTVMLNVAGREYGPEPTDSRGRATLTVVTPPGVTEATQKVLECDAAGESAIELPASEVSRVQIMPVHAGLPADDRLQGPVRAFAVTEQGEPDGGADLVFEASHGLISGMRHEGGGVYAAMYTPPVLGAVTDATIQAVTTDGAETTTVSEVAFKLVPIRPTSLEVTTTPERLSKGDTSLTVNLTVMGPDGSGLAGRALGLTLAGAKQVGETLDNGDGTYAIELSTTGRGPVDIIAAVKAPAAGNPVRDLTVVPTRTRLPPDGLSSSTLTILTLDEFGYPVSDTELALELRSGDGQLPTSARTDAMGIAQVTYTAGRTPGVVHVEAQGGGITRALGLVQLPFDAPEFDLDPKLLSSTEARATAYEQWAPIVTRVLIPRDR
jgi:hypothetical protein